jgi:secreted trypsin-like serine protease
VTETFKRASFLGDECVMPPGVAALSIASVGDRRWSIYDGYLGGAVMVARRWAITAAHCLGSVGGFDSRGVLALTGSGVVLRLTDAPALHRSVADSESGVNVLEVHRHPTFDRRTAMDDLALLRLDADSATTAAIAARRPENGAVAEVVGWGATRLNRVVSDCVRVRRVVIRPDNVCRRQVLELPPDTRFEGSPGVMLCAGGFAKGRVRRSAGACSGDSGGGLFDAETRGLVGIASWTARSCGATHGAPDVYVRVEAYQSWINQVMSASDFGAAATAAL